MRHLSPLGRRTATISLAGIALASMGMLAAFAASVHFIGTPTFTDNGTTLTGCAKLAGLGNGDVTITLAGTGIASYTCTNQGGNQAPGQNKNRITTANTITIPATEIKNGTVTFCVTTQEPPAPTPRQAGCPNKNWTAKVTDVRFSSATFIVEQGGRTVLKKVFTP